MQYVVDKAHFQRVLFTRIILYNIKDILKVIFYIRIFILVGISHLLSVCRIKENLSLICYVKHIQEMSRFFSNGCLVIVYKFKPRIFFIGIASYHLKKLYTLPLSIIS